MNWSDLNLTAAAPDIVLTAALFVVLLVDLWLQDGKRYVTCILSVLAIAVTAVVQLAVWSGSPQYAFHDMFVLDGMAQFSKLVMYALVILLFAYSRAYLKVRDIYSGEFYTLTLFALLGMNIMVSASHFLTLYIGLEMLSLALYALIALRRHDSKATEAALKYFVLGALASGFLLYGISMVYGATGSLQLADVFNIAGTGQANPWLLRLGVVFLVVGIGFKLGVVPFHMWVPDVYQGAPTAVAALTGTAPKIAATVFAFRILVTGLGSEFSFGDVGSDSLWTVLFSGGDTGSHAGWGMMFAVLAVASLLVGNLAAIMQTNIKRMLAFSTVAHMGFVLLAFLGGIAGFASALYYSVIYALMAMAAFGILMLLSSRDTECENVADLAGLNQRHPWYAFLMLLVMFSMAGIPPLAGFFIKLSVIKVLLATGMVWLSVYAVVMSLIGAFYYLRVVKTMYFDDSAAVAAKSQMDVVGRVLLSANALLLLVWGVFPGQVMDWCVWALEKTIS